MSAPYQDIEQAVKTFSEQDTEAFPNHLFMSKSFYRALKNLPEPNLLERFMDWLQQTPYPICRLGFWLERRYIAWWDFRIKHGWVRRRYDQLGL